MMNLWRMMGTMLIYLSFKQKAIRWMGLLLLLISCDRQAPATPPISENTPTIPAPTSTSPPTTIPTPTSTSTPTPDLMRILAPELASAATFPTPTPQPTLAPNPFERNILLQPDTIQKLQSGQPKSDTLDAESGLLGDGTYFDLYQVNAKSGEILQIELESERFDTILYLLDPLGNIVAENDDAYKENTNSALSFSIPNEGTYQVVVNSFSASEGTYTLELDVLDANNPETALVLEQPATGWLLPGDDINDQGLYVDNWTLIMPDIPIILLATSSEFDLRVDVFDSDGNLITRNGDMDRIGFEFDARVALSPSETLESGTELDVRVSLEGEFAIGGAYELLVTELPQNYDTIGTVRIQPVIVKGIDGESGAQVMEDEIRAMVEDANQSWQQCGIEIVMESEAIETISIPGMEVTFDVLEVGSDFVSWTEHEDLLMTHPSHTLLTEAPVVTVYIVPSVGLFGQLGISYTTTRYAVSRSGIIVIDDDVVSGLPKVLAHELGHILGLNHIDLSDGDHTNDTLLNMMFSMEGVEEGTILTPYETQNLYQNITPLQCLVARGTPHYLQSDAPLVPPLFARQDRVLLMGEGVSASLTTRDDVVEGGTGQFLDVFFIYGEMGDEVTIELFSTDFDPVLLIEDPNGEIFIVDDDGGDGWNSRVTFTLPETGDYSLGVTSFNVSVGTYELQVDSEGAR